MTGLQILGMAMIALFLFGMVASMARDMGWGKAAIAFLFSVAITAFVWIGAALSTGRLG